MKKLYLLVFYLLAIPASFSSTVFIDDFNDNSIDASKWTVNTWAGSTAAETNQRLEFGITGGPGTSSGAYLLSCVIPASGWSSIELNGQWASPNLYTGEMSLSLLEANTTHDVTAAYSNVWAGSAFSIRNEGINQYNVSRATPSSLTDFSLKLTRTGIEYWEGGSLVQSFTSNPISDAESFQIKVGGWDMSPYSQSEYFDNINVVMVPEPASVTLLLLGAGALAGRRHRKPRIARIIPLSETLA